ncbi:protein STRICTOSIDINE SYNTHASE-LIKE 10-like [Humulus lupulus]|uniref:protein STRICTOSIDINE SYNTHASE-LIKE 10-like n=1 Tax=Humulus lupulus TaxID=3486 RepID=UPI002B409093|nr:protein STRICTOSIDINE SYNTHASE-LIKE 10-like [Humulus lupulus]
MSSRLLLRAASLAVLAFVLAIYQDPSRINFHAPPPIHGSRDVLHSAQIINVTAALGPESLAFDPSGRGPYAGVADGRILRWEEDGLGWSEFAITSSQREKCVRPFAPEMEHVCGRPLGLRFHKKTGDLYIADAYFGLRVVGPNGGLASPLLTHVEGHPLLFTNDMDIDEDKDLIYFTDSSTTFYRRQFMSAALSGDRTGRLLKYNISSKEVTVLLKDIAFANGVALSKDRSFLLVAETTKSRVLRLWLHGPNAGNVDVFAELPGFPDNIRRNQKEEFWVALHSKKGVISNLVVSKPWAGTTLLKLPLSFKQLHYILVGGKAHATAIKLGEDGRILEVLEDCEGKSLKFISEVEENNGKLWIGSVLMPFIGIYNLH